MACRSTSRRGDRRPDRPEWRRQDDHAAMHRRHPCVRRGPHRDRRPRHRRATPVEAKRRLAFMPDEPHLFEYLTVDGAPAPDRAALRRRRLRGARARRCSTSWSSPGKERVAPGRAVARDEAEGRDRLRAHPRSATTLLFDEPLTGLDPLGIRRMQRDDRRARARRRGDARCRRTCCTWSRRSARASSSSTAASRSPTARSRSSRRRPTGCADRRLEQIFLASPARRR